MCCQHSLSIVEKTGGVSVIMNRLKNGWNHFRTITEHKWVVMQGCFKVGLYRQGLMHDLSKYTPEEFRT